MLKKENNRKVLCTSCFRLVSSNRGSLYHHNNCCKLRSTVRSEDRYIEAEMEIICKGCADTYDNLNVYVSNHIQPCQVHSQFMLQFNINNERIRAPLSQLKDDVDYENFFSFSNDEDIPTGKFKIAGHGHDIELCLSNSPPLSTKSVSPSNTTTSSSTLEKEKIKKRKFLGEEEDSDYSEDEEEVSMIKQTDELIQQKSKLLMKQNGELLKKVGELSNIINESAERIQILTERVSKLSDLDARSMGKVGDIENFDMQDVVELEKQIQQRLLLVQQKRIAMEKQEKEWKSCEVCKENEKTIVLYPCSHMCLCAACATGLKQCPICNSNIVLKVSNKM